MSDNKQRYYPTVEFPDYLDNGFGDVGLPNLCRPDMPVISFPNDRTSAPLRRIGHIGAGPTDRPWLLPGYSRICETLLGVPAIDIEFPGGPYRYSSRLILADGRTVIATRRDAQGRALMEAGVLQQLQRHAAPVPNLLGFNGVVLLQQDLPGQRLSNLLQEADAKAFEKLIGNALASLAEIHQKAEIAGLDPAVPVMGVHPDWLIALLDRPAVIGGFFGIPSPPISIDALYDLLVVLRPRFLKWDARPGNAMVADQGAVAWFDWEHCCARNRLDDMAWLLCDETIPANYPDAEENLIEAYLPLFADGRGRQEAYDYLRVFGVLHLCVRLGRILHAKGAESWQEADINLGKPEPETALRESQRLCQRAAYWSKKTEFTKPLADWFLEIGGRLGDL